MVQRNKEKERRFGSQEKNVIMEHVPQIKHSVEGNLTGNDLQGVKSDSESEKCHPDLVYRDPHEVGGRGASRARG